MEQAADLTPLLGGYIFKHARCMIGEKPIGVKFEAITTKGNLAIFNQMRGKDYKNCRTAIVGLFGASDAYQFRDLITLVPLALDRNDLPSISNRMEEIEFLNNVFISHGEPLRYCYMSGTYQEIMYMIKAFWDEAKLSRDHLNFMYDGIVVSYLDEDIRETLGRKNYINKFSMAVKFDPLEVNTTFRGYTYEVGQNGQITPMIHYDPVYFLGTLHTKSTGSSLDRFKSLALKRGDLINVKYVNFRISPWNVVCGTSYSDIVIRRVRIDPNLFINIV
jgi:NAD-dependent DNA ligase